MAGKNTEGERWSIKINMQEFSKGELFYEPPKQYPEQEFEIDGIKVHFSYITDTLPHFDLYGDISETGYYSVFTFPKYLDELGVEGAAKEAIKERMAVYRSEQEKLKRKRGGKAKNGTK